MAELGARVGRSVPNDAARRGVAPLPRSMVREIGADVAAIGWRTALAVSALCALVLLLAKLD